jgi:hypothetical protein
VKDPDLVCHINSAADKSEVQRILNKCSLNFDEDEFEPAYFNVLTWCQTHDQAEAVQEVGQWWTYLMHILDTSTASDTE